MCTTDVKERSHAQNFLGYGLGKKKKHEKQETYRGGESTVLLVNQKKVLEGVGGLRPCMVTWADTMPPGSGTNSPTLSYSQD